MSISKPNLTAQCSVTFPVFLIWAEFSINEEAAQLTNFSVGITKPFPLYNRSPTSFPMERPGTIIIIKTEDWWSLTGDWTVALFTCSGKKIQKLLRINTKLPLHPAWKIQKHANLIFSTSKLGYCSSKNDIQVGAFSNATRVSDPLRLLQSTNDTTVSWIPQKLEWSNNMPDTSQNAIL